MTIDDNTLAGWQHSIDSLIADIDDLLADIEGTASPNQLDLLRAVHSNGAVYE
jgi:hypothetical protein